MNNGGSGSISPWLDVSPHFMAGTTHWNQMGTSAITVDAAHWNPMGTYKADIIFVWNEGYRDPQTEEWIVESCAEKLGVRKALRAARREVKDLKIRSKK